MQLTVYADATRPSSHHLGKSGAQGTGTITNSWAAVIAVSNKQPFVSDPGVRASTKLWQATLLPCKKDKSSALSPFFTKNTK